MIRITSNLKAYLASMKEVVNESREQTERDIKDACNEMVLRAKETTPPLNGEDRGKNTNTGDLAASWKYEITYSNDGLKTSVKLENDAHYEYEKKLPDGTTIKTEVHYASYVNDGHIMKQHFVPGLYIDGTGALARKIFEEGEKISGLVVGTKTEKVEGYNMVEKAKERFFEAYRAIRENTVKRTQERLNNGNNN